MTQRFTAQRTARRATPFMGVALATVLAGCASGGSGGGSAAQPATRDVPVQRRAVLNDNSGIMYSDAPLDQARTLAAPPAKVLDALRAAFASFEIPVTLDDPATMRVGNPDFQRSRQFMGRRMVELVDCGGTITGPNAFTFRIYLSLVGRVKANAKGGSELTMQLLASGKDVASGASVDRIPCGSSGRIEEMLMNTVQKRLGE